MVCTIPQCPGIKALAAIPIVNVSLLLKGGSNLSCLSLSVSWFALQKSTSAEEEKEASTFALCVSLSIQAYTTVYQSLGSSKGTIFWQTFNSHLADFIDCGSRSASEAARELVAKEKKGTAAAFLIKSGQWSFHYHVGCFCLTKILWVVLKENYSFFKLSSSLTPCHLSLSWSCSSAEAFP